MSFRSSVHFEHTGLERRRVLETARKRASNSRLLDHQNQRPACLSVFCHRPVAEGSAGCAAVACECERHHDRQ
jgi:hypothetical protein